VRLLEGVARSFCFPVGAMGFFQIKISMVLTEVDKFKLVVTGEFYWWRGVLTTMKNGDTGSSYVSRVGDLQQPWKEG
jgi:hypothetical protein